MSQSLRHYTYQGVYGSNPFCAEIGKEKMPFIISNCTVEDFHQILADFDQFWERDAVRAFHHPMFIYEFGDTSFAIKEGDKVLAYLFGFYAQTNPTAYIHLVGVRKSHRRNGYARMLYEHFANRASQHQCTQLKAITTPQNTTSIAFHRRLGFHLIGDSEVDGISVVKDYSGKGHNRIVMIREL